MWEVKPSLAKPPLNFRASLAKPVLTFLVKQTSVPYLPHVPMFHTPPPPCSQRHAHVSLPEPRPIGLLTSPLSLEDLFLS